MHDDGAGDCYTEERKSSYALFASQIALCDAPLRQKYVCVYRSLNHGEVVGNEMTFYVHV